LQKQCIRILSNIVFMFLTAVLFDLTLSLHAGEKELPFHPGEEIKYSVRWERVKAGKASFRVRNLTTVNGEKAYCFILEIESNKYIDIIYKIRDRHEGFANLDFTRSLLYRKTQTGRDKRDVKVLFDWDKKTALYANFGGKRDPIKIPANTFDPLSAFYKMRTLKFKTGQDLSFHVTNGKKHFIQKATVIKKETITISSKTYDTYQLALAVNHFSGVFKKSENPTVKLWITADNRKIPVRIKIKVFIGSVIFDLDSII
jgi:hypothetical protein